MTRNVDTGGVHVVALLRRGPGVIIVRVARSAVLVAASLIGACAPYAPGPDAAASTAVDRVSTVPPDIPPRAAAALTGSAFIDLIADMSREDREIMIRRELLAGNIPSFMRVLHTVDVTATTATGVVHSVSYEVMPDYLAIGSDDDFVRMPMTPYTAQAFCDAFGFVLPTRRMVNDIWQAATVRVDPRPLTEERESPRTFLAHHRIIEAQLEGSARGALVAGSKKDVVITSRLAEQPSRVAIYGWHYPTGEPIQPLYVGHVDWYVDYSHGIRPVRRWMRVNGALRSYEQILGDDQLAGLLSDEGVIDRPRYGR
jgi:hypothetical protein